MAIVAFMSEILLGKEKKRLALHRHKVDSMNERWMVGWWTARLILVFMLF